MKKRNLSPKQRLLARFIKWCEKVAALAAQHELCWLLNEPLDAREAFIDGMTPSEYLEEQVDAARVDL